MFDIDAWFARPERCFIIAEAGVNHDGSLERALQLVDAAAASGADAVKFQTFDAEALASADSPKAAYQIAATGEAETQLDMLRRLQLSAAEFEAIAARCLEKGIVFLSTPFDESSADLLERMDMPLFKVPSGEITNLSFLGHIARKRRPMIVSTGMASMAEVDAAVERIRASGNPSLVLLHCVSNYPADPKDANLHAMRTLGDEFGVPVGYSDHTMGIEVALAAAALGARVIEKHFTLDRHAAGPDHKSSLEPDELAKLVAGVRIVESALGDGVKRPAASEKDVADVARKSLHARCDIAAGSALTAEMIALKRPGTGMAPARLDDVLGRRVNAFIAEGTMLADHMLTEKGDG